MCRLKIKNLFNIIKIFYRKIKLVAIHISVGTVEHSALILLYKQHSHMRVYICMFVYGFEY